MKKLLIASQNPGKLKEFQSLLGGSFQVIHPTEISLEVLEDGKTYQENALKKAQAFFEHYQMPVLSDDSGLEIDVLGGAPGIHSARYGGKESSYEKKFQSLLVELSPFPEESWTARFRCVLCFFYSKEAPPRYFEGVCEGRILRKPEGKEGFGYDPLFYSLDLKKPLGLASKAEKSQVSHRARAIQSFLHWAQNNLDQVS